MEVKIRALDNLNLTAMARGWHADDPMRCVLETRGDVDPGRDLKDQMVDLAESCWILLNDDARPTGTYAKSMSIGDVVQIDYGDGTMYLAVTPAGWDEVKLDTPPAFDDTVAPYNIPAGDALVEGLWRSLDGMVEDEPRGQQPADAG